MNFPRLFTSCSLASYLLIMGCSPGAKKAEPAPTQAQEPAVPAFHFDPTTAGSISGTIRYLGPKPAPKKIDMSEDPACVAAHQGKAVDESLIVSPKGALGNAFIYVKAGLEAKRFETPSTPVEIGRAHV